MGIVSKLLRYTPFYSLYKSKLKSKAEKEHRESEERLLPKRISFYKRFINEGDLVFDVGANVGNRIEAFLQLNAEVIAVEPQPSCVIILQQKFGNKITVEPVGLSDIPGELTMHLATDSTVSSFNTEFIQKTKQRFKSSEWNREIKVPVTTLDKLIAKHRLPGFCKIDVEGFELQVLKGLSSPIPYLSFEYCVPEMTDSMIGCAKQLHQLSPSGLFNYSIGETMELASHEWISLEKFIHLARSTQFTNTLFGDIYFKS